MVVLVLSHPLDGHIRPIQSILQGRGAEVLCIDLADVPLHASFSASLETGRWRGYLCTQERVIDLDQIQAVWWRRPTQATPPATYTPAESAFWVRENERGFTSMLMPSPGLLAPFWVSHPDAIRHAARKPFQLVAAQTLGLRVPRTLLTTDPQAVREFYHACHGQLICKAIGRGVIGSGDEDQPGGRQFLYTSAVTQEHLMDVERVSTMAHYFQEAINKVLDVRVVIIGNQVFAVEIQSPDHGPVRLDWRRDYSQLTYAVHQLPQALAQKLVQLVRSHGLQFSSMDLMLDREGSYYFIEQNPNGQFLWFAQATGLPLAEAMANLLLFPEEFAL
ncbi:MAG TPA: hypothetical protein VFV38_30685 [Ktedonobacteraceae bacterium]|nr:hypothetical protein [Ktedonobacteraceae bacterium]